MRLAHPTIDGVTVTVPDAQADAWRAQGWRDTHTETTRTWSGDVVQERVIPEARPRKTRTKTPRSATTR